MGINYDKSIPRSEFTEPLQEYQVNQTDFIGTKLFPLTPVNEKAAYYPCITRETMTARVDTKRNVRSNYNRTNLAAEDKQYACIEHGLEGQLGDEEIKLYANVFDAELATSKKTYAQLLREQEIRIAALAFNASTWTGDTLFTTATTAWSNPLATVIADVNAGKKKVYDLCGMTPNVLVLNWTNYNYLLTNSTILDRVKYTMMAGEAEVRASLASLFGLEEVLVGKAVYNSKPEGATAFSGSQVWSDTYAMLAIRNASPSLPTVGRTFNWTADSPENVMVEQYREEQTRSGIYRVRQHTEEQVIDSSFAHLIDVASGSGS